MSLSASHPRYATCSRGNRLLLLVMALLPLTGGAATTACEVTSGQQKATVIELYTSEGCSSCPPADQWLSALKGKPVVAQAFHVAYWDYIGWKDRFANPSHTLRQRDLGQTNGLSGVYTPQVVRNGRDWPRWRQPWPSAEPGTLAAAGITLRQTAGTEFFEARITPLDPNRAWSAYWTVTENGHASRVKSGENAGETLQHDFVVRQYVPVGRYQGAQTLRFVASPAQPAHPRHINVIVSDVQTGEPLQAVSLPCG